MMSSPEIPSLKLDFVSVLQKNNELMLIKILTNIIKTIFIVMVAIIVTDRLAT